MICFVEEMSDSLSDGAMNTKPSSLDYDCLLKFLALGMYTTYSKYSMYSTYSMYFIAMRGLVFTQLSLICRRLWCREDQLPLQIHR